MKMAERGERDCNVQVLTDTENKSVRENFYLLAQLWKLNVIDIIPEIDKNRLIY